MELKLFATDLDDTLLKEDATFGEKSRYALQKAIEAGVEVVIASGRAYDSLPKWLLDFPGIRYAVTSNGCAVNAVPSGQRLRAFLLQEDVVLALHTFLADYPHFPITVFYDGKPYAEWDYVKEPQKYGCDPLLSHYIQTTRIPLQNVWTFALQHKNELDSINVLCPDHATQQALIQSISDSVPPVMAVCSTDRLIELVDPQAGKASGLSYLCQKIGCTAEQTVACGNANNDIDMLRFAKIGAAVKNASADCLAAADVVLPSNEQEGVASFLLSLLEEKKTGC